MNPVMPEKFDKAGLPIAQARSLVPQVARTLLGQGAAGGSLTVLRALAPRVTVTRGFENLLLLVRAHPGDPLAYSFILPP